MIDSSVVEVDVLEEEGLAHRVVGQVPEVSGGKGHLIDPLEARVALADDMLLNQLHPVPPYDESASAACTLRRMRERCLRSQHRPGFVVWRTDVTSWRKYRTGV